MSKSQISHYQFALLVIGAITVLGHLYIVPLVFDEAGKDSWLSLLVALVPGSFMVIVLAWLAILKPQKSLDQIATDQFGKLVGKVVAFIYMVYFLIAAALGLRGLMEFLKTALLQDTPRGVTGVSFLVLCYFAVKSGLKNIARTYSILMWILIFVGFLVACLASPEKDYQNLLPMMEKGVLPVIFGSFPLIGLLGELVVIGAIQGSVRNSAAIWQSNLASVFFIGLFFLGPLTGPVAMFGEGVAKFNYPTFAEMKFGSYLVSFHSLAMILWLFGHFGRLSLYYYAATESCARLSNLGGYRSLAIPTGFIIILLAQFAFPDLATIKKFLIESYPVMGVSVGIVLPTVLLVAVLLGKATRRGSRESQTN